MGKRKGQVANLPDEKENRRSIAAILIKKYGLPGGKYGYLKSRTPTLAHRPLTDKEVDAVFELLRKAGKIKT